MFQEPVRGAGTVGADFVASIATVSYKLLETVDDALTCPVPRFVCRRPASPIFIWRSVPPRARYSSRRLHISRCRGSMRLPSDTR